MVIAFISIIRDVWGGSEELWAACAKEALLKKHKVIISAYDCGVISSKTQELIDKGAILEKRIGTIRKEAGFLGYMQKRFLRIYQKTLGNPFHSLFKYEPSIILYIGTGNSIAYDFKLLHLIKKKKTNFFINVQLGSEGYKELSEKEISVIDEGYQSCKRIFFVSKRNQMVTETLLNRMIENGVVVRNPVNISSVELIPFPSNVNIQLAMVGNLRVVHKGQDIVLEILSSAIWKQRNWHLNIYGSGEDENYLQDLVSHYQLTDKVTFHGKVNDIRGVWEKNHILLMPSHMEGMPLAVVEAMLCGRPCVGTDVGGIAEWIEEGKSGFIAEAPTVASFGKSMERAWEHLNDWEVMGRNAHERAMQLYDPQPGKTLLKLITESIP